MDKKKIILTIIVFVLFIIAFALSSYAFQKYAMKNSFEKSILPFANLNNKTVFTVNKIVLFSNCDAKNKASYVSNFTIENLYQYTDIALFINNSSKEEKTPENTFKKVSISNVKFNTPPEQGDPKLFFKSINHFSKSEIIPENEIKDNFEFTITSEDEANLDEPVLYNNLANPITLCYINQNIKSDYTINDSSSSITYDGSLLKKCSVPLSSISCNLSFDINITNNQDEEFKTTVYLNIPLEMDKTTLYDGHIKCEESTNFVFYRYK